MSMFVPGLECRATVVLRQGLPGVLLPQLVMAVVLTLSTLMVVMVLVVMLLLLLVAVPLQRWSFGISMSGGIVTWRCSERMHLM